MRKIYLSGALLGASAITMAGCNGSTTTNVNINRPVMTTDANTNYNSGMSNMNSNMNSNRMMSANPDNDFMKEAATGGMAEVEMGKMMAVKATNPEVKKFAQMIVTDHTAANNELKALAAKKNVTLPTDVDASQKSTMDMMKTKSGADLDKEYVENMVSDHEKDVADFQKQSMSATDPDVKAFAAKTLPTLKKHLDAIKAIQSKMK